MKLVSLRIVPDWGFTYYCRLTPRGLGVWDGLRLTQHEEEADYTVVLNQPNAAMRIVADPDRVWAIIQEPPTPFHRFLHAGQPGFGRVYTSDLRLPALGARYIASQPVLGWQAGLTFDELAAMPQLPAKSKNVSWITSHLAFLPGHLVRLKFMDRIRPTGLVDIFGRGLNPVNSKWEALAPYRYSIVFENWVGPYYWSEKIADAFLAGAMPIYVGCTNLDDYFPAGSYIRLDAEGEDPVGDVRRIVESDLAERSRDLILEARRRVLYQHQPLPFLARQIAADPGADRPARPVSIDLKVRKLRHPYYLGLAAWHWKIKPVLVAAEGSLRRKVGEIFP